MSLLLCFIMLCLTLEASEVVGKLLGSKVVKKVLVCRLSTKIT